MRPIRAERVQDMFASVAARYDAANTVLSGGMHHGWRRRAVGLLAPPPAGHILDACTGTGDLAFAVAEAMGPTGRVTATDFCEPMLELGREKSRRRRPGATVTFSSADLLALPFSDRTFDGATVGFGVRNTVDPVRALRELRRVVKPGAPVVILEFGQPRSRWFGALFEMYSRWGIPRLGGWLTGHREAYEYLPKTSAAFPCGEKFVEELAVPAGLEGRRAVPLTGGIAWIYCLRPTGGVQ